MSRHSRALAGLTLVIAVGVGGLILTRQMIAVAGEADAERLNRSILQYVALKNPQAPIKAFQRFPEVLVAEAQKSNLDHCLVLAQAEVEFVLKEMEGHATNVHYFGGVQFQQYGMHHVEIYLENELRLRFPLPVIQVQVQQRPPG